MTNDALDRLRKRKRPSVAPRDITLVPPPAPTPATPQPETTEPEVLSEVQISGNRDINKPKNPGKKKSGNADINKSRSRNIEVLENLDIPTKQTTLRLEKTIASELQILCSDQEISREVLIEAMLLHCQAEPEALRSILTVAQQRHRLRVQAANQKRARSMMEKFG